MGKIYKYCAVAALCFLTQGVGNLQAETLQEAVKHMLVTNPDIKANAYNRLAREQEVLQAESGYYPRVDVMSSIGLEDHYEPNTYTRTPRQNTLSLRQNVYNGMATTNEIKRHEARVESSAFTMQATSENTALRTTQVYLNVLKNMELYELAKENLTIHERIFDQIKLRSESGVDRKSDLDQTEARVALARTQLVIMEINLLDAKTNYQAVIGYMPENLIKPAALDVDLPPSLERAQEIALAGHPTLKSAQADLEAREFQDKVAESPFRPVIDIEIDKNWQEDFNDFKGWEEELITMLRVRWNLYSGGKDKSRKTETKHLISEAREIRNHTHRQVIESIGLSWRAYQAAQDKIVHQEDYVRAISATAEAQVKQWNIGKRTLFDVLDIEAEKINAQKDLISTQYDFLYAQYRIFNGMGRLVRSLGLELPDENLVDRVEENVSGQGKSPVENANS
ncbi:MAG: TolC family outer membrane protein [Pseudomonadota bacterium]